jgi:purine-nucleoside phosphorylase
MQGRVHYYEGYSPEEVTFPVRVFGSWGIRTYLATNASGGINPGIRPGEICLIHDHINLMGVNPLVGANNEKFGPRFPDMSRAYDPELADRMTRAACDEGIPLHRGVYVAFSGPSFETPAEIRMARTMGADLVGMSTVPEVIVANHMGMRVCALSCVANHAAGMTAERLSHQEVLTEMNRAAGTLSKLVLRFLEGLDRPCPG